MGGLQVSVFPHRGQVRDIYDLATFPRMSIEETFLRCLIEIPSYCLEVLIF
jgi:hypothetical protein